MAHNLEHMSTKVNATQTQPSNPSSVSEPIERILVLLLLVAAYTHNLWLSWLKWGDAVMDLGCELDIARQLAAGKALYSEVWCDVGPLNPYFNALLFKLFGVHLTPIIVMGLIVTAVMSVLLYALARRFTSRWPAALIAAAFLYICAFAHLSPNSTFNWVLPYRTSATYGMCLVAASLLFLVRFSQEQRRSDIVLSWIWLGLAALTKQELIIAIVVTHLVFLISTWMESLRKDSSVSPTSLRFLIAGYLITGLAVLLVYLPFLLQASGEGAGPEVGAFVAAISRRFLLLHMGLLDVPNSLLAIGYSLLAVGGLILSCVAVAKWLPATREWRVIACVLAFIGATIIYWCLNLEYPFRLLPVLGACTWVFLARRWYFQPALRTKLAAELLLWTCALACMVRFGLVTIPYHYGFFLLPIPLVSFGLFWFHHLPQWLATRVRWPEVFRYAGAGLLIALIIGYLRISEFTYAMHTAEMNTPRGHLFLYNPPPQLPGLCCVIAINLLAEMPPQTSVIVIPQGVGLSFFSGRDNPYGMQGYVETLIVGRLTDESLLKTLQANPPDIVVRAFSDTSEHGDGVFGKTYAVQSWAWITAHYKRCVSIGNGFIVIYCREGVDPSPMLALIQAIERQN